MADWKRSDTCGALSEADEGRQVTLNGWVENRRDHGGIFFLDLRDRYGVTQVLVDEDSGLFASVRDLAAESVVAVHGSVRRRAPEHVNPGRITGAVEVRATEIQVLGPSRPVPFEIVDRVETSIETRLRYRYLDLRRRPMLKALETRSRFLHAVRDYLQRQEFMEVETPVLTKATPEGARDYLVPSRVHPGRFYALPQSPQLFKQLLMVGGVDRYYQIARCFRDEDLRADRQPDFTQIDLEMSFVEEEDILRLVEGMVRHAFLEGFGIELPEAFPRLTWKEAMVRYGTDKPDLRFGLEIQDLGALAERSAFPAFSATKAAGGVVRALVVPGGGERVTRKALDGLEQVAKEHGAKGLAWLKREGEEARGPLARFYAGEALAELSGALGLGPGDLLVAVAGSEGVVASALGQVRLALGRSLGLVEEKTFRFLWVTEFPLFEHDPETGRFSPAHHAFTAPRDWNLTGLDESPEQLLSRAYDLVLNGAEVASGSIRIHRCDIQERIFQRIGLSEEEARAKFGFLLEAFQYGAPPHGGIALGADRLVALALGLESIRDVIAFPKTSSATCLLTDAPSMVTPEQLGELHIHVDAPPI